MIRGKLQVKCWPLLEVLFELHVDHWHMYTNNWWAEVCEDESGSGAGEAFKTDFILSISF